MAEQHVVIVGGTAGIGLELARHLVAAGDDVVVTGRDAGRAEQVAKELGGRARGLGFDLARPADIGPALTGMDRVDHLVLAAIERDVNTCGDYDIDRALRLVTLKLVGYTEVVHALLPRMAPDASIVLFGGGAKDRPYPGSTTVSTVNGGVMGMMNSLASELAPIRVNTIQPGIVGDSPFWRDKPAAVLDAFVAQTPLGRLATMAEVVDAVVFLMRNSAVNGVTLRVDGGWLLT
ncbi:MAG TPA: SDR family oxidoreductase [Micromonosporaceae bacterium]|jgi:NAD(P)-dependent dehydrogenase (short-subunit alcohol dehydrogenase family)